MIPRSQSLKIEDFPDQSDWIGPLLRAVNQGASQTSSALSSQLTFGENMNATLKTVELTLRDDWQTPTLSSSWVALAGQQAPQYRRVGDRVEIRGGISTGTVASAAFTLPEGYRPPSDLRFATSSNGAYGDFTVTAAGVVTPTVGSNVSFWLNCSFAVSSPRVVNGAFPFKVSHGLTSGAKAVGCWLVSATDITDGARSSTSGAGYVAWRPNGSEIIVDDIPGLSAGRKYSVTLLVSGG